MQQDRQHIQPTSHILPRIRAPGRGRRDPQAEDEDAFVEELRDRHTAWKVVRQEFQERFKKDASEARLQMRLHRRYRERMVRWEESDVSMYPPSATHSIKRPCELDYVHVWNSPC